VVKCCVPNCPSADVERVTILIGGERVRAAFCAPHGAEYRVNEIKIEEERHGAQLRVLR
jgi:hypothetical protein